MSCKMRSCLLNLNIRRYSIISNSFSAKPVKRPVNPLFRPINRTAAALRANRTGLMRAIVLKQFGNPDFLNLTDVPMPVPAESEVLIRVVAAGINPVDVYIRQGIYRQLPELPAILGKEISGVVVEIDKNASSEYNIKVGDRVFAKLDSNGGYAEYVSTHIDNVIPLPDNMTFSQGAALYVTYFTAYRALKIRAKLNKNDKILIHGASGGVGTAAIQIAKHLGIKHIGGTAGTERGLKLIRELGVNYAFNHRKKGHMYEAKLAMGGKGIDFILENAADLHLADDCNSLAPNGQIAIVGCRDQTWFTPRSLMASEGKVFGVNLGFMSKTDLNECTKFLLKGIEEGWINPVIGREYVPEEALKAHSDMILKMTTLGKLVFRMDLEIASETSESMTFSTASLGSLQLSSEFDQFAQNQDMVNI